MAGKRGIVGLMVEVVAVASKWLDEQPLDFAHKFWVSVQNMLCRNGFFTEHAVKECSFDRW